MMLYGPTVYLQPYEPEDWCILHNYYINPKYRDFFRHYPKVFNKEALRQYHNIVGGELFWIKEYTGEIVGFMSLTIDNKANRGFYIGLFIGEAFQKQHIPTEAMVVLMRYAFNTLDLRKCKICVLEENESLNKTLQRTDFIQEGMLFGDCYQDGEYKHENIYCMFADDFRRNYTKFLGGRICKE